MQMNHRFKENQDSKHELWDFNSNHDHWERLTRLVTHNSSWGQAVYCEICSSVIHTLWREKNKRRHGESVVTALVLIRRLDKAMRNQFTVICRRGDREYGDSTAMWFESRELG
ncbi:hypothetical protein Bca4012_047420 [Brassica carinata]